MRSRLPRIVELRCAGIIFLLQAPVDVAIDVAIALGAPSLLISLLQIDEIDEVFISLRL